MKLLLKILLVAVLTAASASVMAMDQRAPKKIVRLPSGTIIVVYENPPARKQKEPDHWDRTRAAYFDYHYGYRRGQPMRQPAPTPHYYRNSYSR